MSLATGSTAEVGEPSTMYSPELWTAWHHVQSVLPCSHSQGTTVTPERGKSRAAGTG